MRAIFLFRLNYVFKYLCCFEQLHSSVHRSSWITLKIYAFCHFTDKRLSFLFLADLRIAQKPRLAKMGNTHSMNNMSMLDQKRYQAEFLRYSQIPYESQYHQQQQQQHQSLHASNMSLHQFNNYKEQREKHALANPVKVLPDVKFDSKLRTTNNGAILQSGGTISGRKESDVSFEMLKFLWV